MIGLLAQVAEAASAEPDGLRWLIVFVAGTAIGGIGGWVAGRESRAPWRAVERSAEEWHARQAALGRMAEDEWGGS